LAHGYDIKPATAALAPCYRAKFMPPLAKALADSIIKLGWEWPLPNPRCVRLHDAKHIADLPRPRAGTRRGLPRPVPEPVAACPAMVFDEVTYG